MSTAVSSARRSALFLSMLIALMSGPESHAGLKNLLKSCGGILGDKSAKSQHRPEGEKYEAFYMEPGPLSIEPELYSPTPDRTGYSMQDFVREFRLYLHKGGMARYKGHLENYRVRRGFDTSGNAFVIVARNKSTDKLDLDWAHADLFSLNRKSRLISTDKIYVLRGAGEGLYVAEFDSDFGTFQVQELRAPTDRSDQKTHSLQAYSTEDFQRDFADFLSKQPKLDLKRVELKRAWDRLGRDYVIFLPKAKRGGSASWETAQLLDLSTRQLVESLNAHLVLKTAEGETILARKDFEDEVTVLEPVNIPQKPEPKVSQPPPQLSKVFLETPSEGYSAAEIMRLVPEIVTPRKQETKEETRRVIESMEARFYPAIVVDGTAGQYIVPTFESPQRWKGNEWVFDIDNRKWTLRSLLYTYNSSKQTRDPFVFELADGRRMLGSTELVVSPTERFFNPETFNDAQDPSGYSLRSFVRDLNQSLVYNMRDSTTYALRLKSGKVMRAWDSFGNAYAILSLYSANALNEGWSSEMTVQLFNLNTKELLHTENEPPIQRSSSWSVKVGPIGKTESSTSVVRQNFTLRAADRSIWTVTPDGANGLKIIRTADAPERFK